ncbi:two-component system, NtrC family, sensor histidine kinase AtoS [Evansella caseinilytica]|uniref:histidine kinase n=1 Tax=Evansella caseinilytica TaxID=1503961 RepID=A0A1H3U0P5_9BACI|nr:HAMP domain-containing sensor histidine kinase [Evansella caseinilytica]SDZ55912.1 two-component system, NtrC family, sensor histidine kinase AtoS [Evansella caseinilytica]
MKGLFKKMTFRSKIMCVLLLITLILTSFSLILIDSIEQVNGISTEVKYDNIPELMWISNWEKELGMKEFIVVENGLKKDFCCEFVELYESFRDDSAAQYDEMAGPLPESLKQLKAEMDLLDFKITNNVGGLLKFQSFESAAVFLTDNYLPHLHQLQEQLVQEKQAVFSKLETDFGNFSNIIKKSLLFLVIFSSGAIIIGIIFSYHISAGLTRPLEKMVEKVDRIANGQYGLAVSDTGQVELQHLTKSINQMSQRLKESFETIMTDKIYREQILNSLPVGIITVDERSSEGSLNRTAKLLLGYEEESFHFCEKHIGGRKDNQDFWNIFRSKRIVQNAKVIFEIRDEKYSLLVSQSKLFDQQKKPIGRIFYFIDITDTEKLEKRMHQSEKLALVGELAAGAAHEIRNPLAVIDGFLSLMNQSLTAEERNRFHMPLLTKELERINAIIEEMLLLSKPSAPQFRETYLQEVIDDILPLINESHANENIDFQIDLTKELLTMDVKQMKQVFYNLIRNSIDAMGSSGKITISSKVANRSYHIFVKDSGSGIPKELQRTIFDPFLTSKETGTGLGLTIVQRIIDNHHGDISLVSSSHEGTVFRISLPLQMQRKQAL